MNKFLNSYKKFHTLKTMKNIQFINVNSNFSNIIQKIKKNMKNKYNLFKNKDKLITDPEFTFTIKTLNQIMIQKE